jgi:hypothetical protein
MAFGHNELIQLINGLICHNELIKLYSLVVLIELFIGRVGHTNGLDGFNSLAGPNGLFGLNKLMELIGHVGHTNGPVGHNGFLNHIIDPVGFIGSISPNSIIGLSGTNGLNGLNGLVGLVRFGLIIRIKCLVGSSASLACRLVGFVGPICLSAHWFCWPHFLLHPLVWFAILPWPQKQQK